MKLIKKTIINVIGYRRAIYLYTRVLLIRNFIIYVYNYIIVGEKLSPEFTLIKYGTSHTFFGYYDKNPFSENNKNILCHVVASRLSQYKSNTEAQLMLYNLGTGGFSTLGTTKLRNTQMGSRVHRYNKTSIMYNDIINGRMSTVIRNINPEGEVQYISYPFYDLSMEKDYILGLDFIKLEAMRPGYGYYNTLGTEDDFKDGIYKYDINTKKIEYVIFTKQLQDIARDSSMDGADHYVNHISCNTYNNNSFTFFHLRQKNNTRKVRLFHYDVISKNLKLVVGGSGVSHYAWKSKDEILITASTKEGTGYFLCNIKHDTFQNIGGDNLAKDGHPTFLKSGLFISDTYPDKSQHQELFTYNIATGVKETFGKILHNPVFEETFRTDLHPRISNDRKYFCIDSNMSGTRSMIVGKTKI